MWDAIKLYMSKIWTIIKPTVMAFLSQAGKQVLDMAMEIVTDLAKSDLSSDEKRSAAFSTIKEKLEAEGKVVGNSLINLAIELAVQRLKSLQ
jgi:hypothetical protein